MTPKGGPGSPAREPGPNRSPQTEHATTAANDHNTPAMNQNKLPDPTPERIKAARKRAGITQTEAADLVHIGAKTRWSEYENGRAPIDLARWELFLIKTGQRAP